MYILLSIHYISTVQHLNINVEQQQYSVSVFVTKKLQRRCIKSFFYTINKNNKHTKAELMAVL